MKKSIMLNLQLIVAMLLVIALLVGMFVKGLDIIVFSLMAILLFILSYNNYKIYKRKYMSPIYLIFGIIVLAKVVMELING